MHYVTKIKKLTKVKFSSKQFGSKRGSCMNLQLLTILTFAKFYPDVLSVPKAWCNLAPGVWRLVKISLNL